MTSRERFTAIMNGVMPDDRLPMVEWAAWWDQTINRWQKEGLPPTFTWANSQTYFGLDEMHCLGAGPDVPPAPAHGAPVIASEADYDRIRDRVFSDAIIENLLKAVRQIQARHDAGEIIIRIWLDGFFWFPRRLFGIENHLYAFYDYPELMHRMNSDLRDFNQRVMEALFPILKPDFVGYGEDMSYNHGPMLSRELFNEFILPYYRPLTAFAHSAGVYSLVDSDGDVTDMIQWFKDAGLNGVYPLERQAGVDIARIRREHPDFIMLGGYDKMVMNQGEAAIRAEFERILPVMRSGRYIPSVDHQTPPGVSLEDFRCYMRLFKEYAEKAAG